MAETKTITGLFRNIPKNIKSHNAAYARVWADLLGAETECEQSKYEADITIIYLDINYTGKKIQYNGVPIVNIFDGISTDIFERISRFLNYEGN